MQNYKTAITIVAITIGGASSSSTQNQCELQEVAQALPVRWLRTAQPLKLQSSSWFSSCYKTRDEVVTRFYIIFFLFNSGEIKESDNNSDIKKKEKIEERTMH